MLFQASVQDLFEAPEPLLCCGDDVCLRGGRHDASSFAPLLPGHPPGAADAPDRPFGAGFLLIDEQVIAVCESICLRYRTRLGVHFQRQFVVPDKSLPTATHVANCLS